MKYLYFQIILLLLFFPLLLSSQVKVGLSFSGVFDMYTVDQPKNAQILDSGFEAFKRTTLPDIYQLELSLLDKRNEKFQIRYNLIFSPFESRRKFRKISSSSSGGHTPINLNVSFNKDISILDFARLNLGAGLGFRFIPRPYYREGRGKVIRDRKRVYNVFLNGEGIDLHVHNIEYMNKFSMYVPILIGLEYDLGQRFSIYLEYQRHISLREISYSEIEYFTEKQGAVFETSEVSTAVLKYGNYATLGFGVRFSL